MRFDGWLLSKTSAHNIAVDAKQFRTTTVCFFPPNLRCDLLKFTCPFYIEYLL